MSKQKQKKAIKQKQKKAIILKPKQSYSAIEMLAYFFYRNGYLRRQNKKRIKKEGSHKYKKGDEVRLVAESKPELMLIRRLLRETGFKTCKPFTAGLQFRQPIYGRESVAEFLEKIGFKEEIKEPSQKSNKTKIATTPKKKVQRKAK